MKDTVSWRVGLLKASGRFGDAVYQALSNKFGADVHPVSVMMDHKVHDDRPTMPSIPLHHTEELIDHFLALDVRRVVFAGRAGLIRAYVREDVISLNDVEDDELRGEYAKRSAASVERVLDRVADLFESAGIMPCHINELLDDFNVSQLTTDEQFGKIGGMRTELFRSVREALVSIFAQGENDAVRGNYVFLESEQISIYNEQMKVALSELEAVVPGPKSGITLAKVAKPGRRVTFSAPFFDFLDLQDCKEAGVEVVFLDSGTGLVLVDDDFRGECTDHPIQVVAISLTH